MKKPVVDYREFRLSKLNTPQFSHLKLLLGWLVYFAFYFLTENLIPLEKCHPVHIWLDDVVPFCEGFVIAYTSWYALIVFSLGYFALYDIDSFKRLSKFIMMTQAIAMVAYIVYPTRQDLRPEVFPRENFLTWVMGLIYSFDTSSGVCPSLHVGYSIGIASVWLKRRESHLAWKLVLTVWVALICASVMFVKQHSGLDIIMALPMCAVAELVVYRDRYFQKANLKAA